MLRRLVIRWTVAIVSTLLCASLLHAQEPPVQPPKSDAEAKQDKARGDALVRVRALADRIDRMREADVKIRALAQLAGITCKYDKASAELIFYRAYSAYEAALRDARLRLPRGEQPTGYGSLRREIFQEMMRCLPDLATRLMRTRESESTEDATAGLTATNLNAATALLEQDPAKAVEFATRALEAQLDRDATISLLDFLHNLRQQRPDLADQFFLRMLDALRTERRADAERLLLIGNYLFTSIGAPETDPRGAAAQIGGVAVPSIGANRSWITVELVRPYLEASLDILSRPVDDARLQQLDLGALYQLIAKSREFAPDLTASFDLLFDRTRLLLAQRAATSAELQRLQGHIGHPDLPSLIEQLRGLKETAERDAMLLQIAHRYLNQGKFVEARDYIGQIKTLELREHLSRLADFVEAAHHLAMGNLDLSFEAMNRLPAGPHRALLNLGYAVLHYRGNPGSARARVNLAESDIERLPAAIRARFLVAAAAVSALHDNDPVLQPQNTLAILRRAVAAFNAAKREELTDLPRPDLPASRPLNRSPQAKPRLKAFDGGWGLGANGRFWEDIRLNEYSGLLFDLKVEGVEIFDLRDTRIFARLGQSARAAENILSQLEDEDELAPALAALAIAYLEEGFRKPAAPARRALKNQNHNRSHVTPPFRGGIGIVLR